MVSLEQCKPAEAYQQTYHLSFDFEGFISQPDIISKDKKIEWINSLIFMLKSLIFTYLVISKLI